MDSGAHSTRVPPAHELARGLPRRAARAIRIALAGALAAGCGPAAPADTAALEDTLRRRIEHAYDFTRPDVVGAMMDLYPDTGRVISASDGHLMTTPDSLRQGLTHFWTNVGVTMQNPVFRWDDVFVDRLGEHAAVLTGRFSIPHIAPTGRPHTIRGAWTAVFRRVGGEWKIVHEHLSVPPSGS